MILGGCGIDELACGLLGVFISSAAPCDVSLASQWGNVSSSNNNFISDSKFAFLI
jgi:hypothetical protein